MLTLKKDQVNTRTDTNTFHFNYKLSAIAFLLSKINDDKIINKVNDQNPILSLISKYALHNAIWTL